MGVCVAVDEEFLLLQLELTGLEEVGTIERIVMPEAE